MIFQFFSHLFSPQLLKPIKAPSKLFVFIVCFASTMSHVSGTHFAILNHRMSELLANYGLPQATSPQASLADITLANPFADSNALFTSSSSLASSLSLEHSSSSRTSFDIVLSRGHIGISNTDEGWEADSEMDEITSTVSLTGLICFSIKLTNSVARKLHNCPGER